MYKRAYTFYTMLLTQKYIIMETFKNIILSDKTICVNHLGTHSSRFNAKTVKKLKKFD